jgi:hypothetical protein
MPNMNIRADYATWLATPSTTGVLVETLQFYGPAFQGLWLANRTDDIFVANDELGIARTYQPIAFTLSRPAIRNSTELSMTARIDGIDGALFRALSLLTNDQLNYPVYCNLRAYVWPNMLDRSVFGYPLTLRVESAKVAIPIVELTLVGGRLTNKSAGRFYTLQRFVGLRPF